MKIAFVESYTTELAGAITLLGHDTRGQPCLATP
jgi:hypothetical protein